MPPKRAKKAAPAPPPPPPLLGCRIVLSGQFPKSISQTALKAKAEALGAIVPGSTSGSTTHIIASEFDYNKPSNKVAFARTIGIPIVSLEWLLKCEEKNARQAEADFVPGAAAPDSDDDEPVAASSQANGTAAIPSRTRKRTLPIADADDTDAALPKTKKPRGRKAAEVKAEEEEEEEEGEVEDEPEPVPEPPKKTRGRKAKAAPVKKEEESEEDEPESEPEPEPVAKVGKALGEGQVAKDKSIQVPLDEGCPYYTSKVYIGDDGVIYDASLNQTNASNNNNKFYRVQLLVDPAGTYRTWTRWGRVGERGQTALAGEGPLARAMSGFEKKFKDKSGLSWAQRGENPKPGKYAFVERNYSADSDDEEDEAEDTKGKKASDWQPPQSTLEPAVAALMQLIFNQSFFAATMTALNYDVKKLPLGKLSKATIMRGFQALKDLSALIDTPTLAANYDRPFPAAVEQLSNSFYSLIPHAFGRNRPPVITDQNMVKREIELLESLSDMKEAANIMKLDKTGDDDIHPLDKQFQGLGLEEMTPLDPATQEFEHLQDYLMNTRGSTHNANYRIEAIFRIERQGEKSRFDSSPFAGPPRDRRLLWHGSRSTNFGGILSQGLRIAPPEAPVSGYMFGKGIYLADMSSKSANYCCPNYSNGTALLLLCEAELGDPMQQLTGSSYNAGDEAKAKGMISTWGMGLTGPTQWKDASCAHPSLAEVKMPDTSVPITHGNLNVPGAYLYYNEFIAYDVAQVRLRYLFRVKM
ncbi:poly-ribose polymerase-like protein [Podospora appendiculata]|uniref:Poly [ADP-ribose] polymerase n=1 Tax=Podospora appendiculata TaxID=314037 RepID=A0AAE1CB35_9PEZI|nr:poly-ribose polymerase-like protein [Podospora appendiculata]